jgi:hypothetical protein
MFLIFTLNMRNEIITNNILYIPAIQKSKDENPAPTLRASGTWKHLPMWPRPTRRGKGVANTISTGKRLAKVSFLSVCVINHLFAS